jgi:hypothetical protein
MVRYRLPAVDCAAGISSALNPIRSKIFAVIAVWRSRISLGSPASGISCVAAGFRGDVADPAPPPPSGPFSAPTPRLGGVAQFQRESLGETLVGQPILHGDVASAQSAG